MRGYKFSDPENKVDLILSRADIFETPKDIDDFTNCPTHRSNLGVGWSRGSSSRCRVPKEVSGHGKGRVKSIPRADRGIGKLVSRIAAGARIWLPNKLHLGRLHLFLESK